MIQEKNKKTLSPKLDVVFQALFGEVGNERITKAFLQEILKEKIDKIELNVNPILRRETIEDKMGVLDVVAKINNKQNVDIEMQMISNEKLPERILYYWARLFSKGIKKGEDYEKLEKTIAILITNEKIEKFEELKYHTEWKIFETENKKEILTDKLEIHIIELEKIEDNNQESNDKLLDWLYFLINPDSRRVKNKMRENEELKEAKEKLDKITEDAKKSTDSDYTKYDSNIITNLSNGTYNIKVIAYDKAGNQKAVELKSFEVKKEIKRTNISAQDIKNNPEGYYGQTVDYTSSLNGQNDWKIFHSDGTNIYLITGNYVKVTDDNGNIDTNKLNSETKMQIASGGQNYRVNWNYSNFPSFNTDVSADIISKFKINTSVFDINSKKNNTSYPNAQCVSTLLNSNYWTGYIDNSKGNNQTAIGGPTVQLWMDSWNARYPEQKVYCDNANTNGYYVGTSSKPTSTSFSLNKNENKGGELYFANNRSALADGNDTVDYYWLASPSANASYNVLSVYYGGGVSYINYYFGYGGLRPVVCLQSNISLK